MNIAADFPSVFRLDAAGLGAIGLLLTGLACGRPPARPATSPSAAPVRLVAATPAGQDDWIPASLNQADLATLSTRLAGTVKRIHVAEGARVAAGQLLLELEAGDLLGQLRAAESARDAAVAHHARIQRLVARGAATPSELELAAAGRAAAEGAVAGVKGQLAHAQIRAPFQGTVQRRDAQVGAFVSPGQPLLTLEGSGPAELSATLSEREAASLRVGLRVPFEAEGRQGEARITAIAPGGDPLTHRRALRARVLSPVGLPGGAFARIRVPVDRASGGQEGRALRIPLTALVQREGLAGVLVAQDGYARLRWLSLGERDGPTVEVRAGLDPGEPVIADPARLKDGQAVRVEGPALAIAGEVQPRLPSTRR